MATNGNTYDISPPRPPNLADFNGAQKEDDGTDPPDPTTMPNAPEWNTVEQTLVAMGNILPLIEVSLASDASVVAVLSPVSAIQGAPGAFYITHTSTGQYVIEIGNGVPANGFPAFTGQPKAFLNDLNRDQATIAAAYITGPNGKPAVKVLCYQNGTATDMAFTAQFR